MGGLAKKIPYTYAMMMIGTLAITGFPFLAAIIPRTPLSRRPGHLTITSPSMGG